MAVALAALKDHHCRWPLWPSGGPAPAPEAPCFCGAHRIAHPRLPYCPEHARAAAATPQAEARLARRGAWAPGGPIAARLPAPAPEPVQAPVVRAPLVDRSPRIALHVVDPEPPRPPRLPLSLVEQKLVLALRACGWSVTEMLAQLPGRRPEDVDAFLLTVASSRSRRRA